MSHCAAWRRVGAPAFKPGDKVEMTLGFSLGLGVRSLVSGHDFVAHGFQPWVSEAKKCR